MQRRIYRRLPIGFRAGSVLATILLLGNATSGMATETGASPDSSAPPVSSDSDRWQPALGMGFLLSYQDQIGSNPVGPFAAASVSGSTSQDAMVSPAFRFDASVATPVLVESTFAPRLFAQVGTQLLLEEDYIAWRSLSAGSPFSSTLLTTTIDSQWYAGAGLEFLIPAGQRKIRLRTAIDYVGQTISANARADRKVKLSSGGSVDTEWVAPTVNSTNHALGVGVSGEAAVYRWRNMRVSLFLEMRIAWLLEANEMRLTAVNAGNPALTPSEFIVRPDSTIAQGGGGIRISWLPHW